MSKTVLVTGGSGLVGSRLTELLLEEGFQVSHLGRTKRDQKHVKSYTWDIKEGFVEKGALESANFVVHLAGAGVADKRWSDSRKKVILKSRVNSTALLYEKLKSISSPLQAVVSASAVGIYGWDTGDSWVNENTAPGEGFLAEVTRAWEGEIRKLEELNLRVVMLRIGVVLSNKGGALPKIVKPVELNAGAPLGSGDQYMSWIHIDDLCRMFIKALKDEQLSGAYNAAAPHPVTNREFTEAAAEVLDKRLWLPPVPGFALKLMLGEMAQVVLGGNRVSSEKIVSEGFNFKFTEVRPALKSLLN